MSSTKFGFKENQVSPGRLAEGYFAFGWANESAEFMRQKKFPRVIFEGNWGDFGFISEFSDCILELILENDARDASGVETLKNMTGLWMRFASKKPVHLEALQKLEICSIYWNKAYGKTLFALPALKNVTIHSFGSDNFSELSANASIAVLEMIRPKIQSLQGLNRLDALTELNMTFASRLENLDALCSASKLTALTIVNAPHVENFPAGLMLPSLQKLVLSNVGGLRDLNFLDSMNSLVTLSIGGFAVSPHWAGLAGLPNLKKIQLLVNKSEMPSEMVLQAMFKDAGKEIKKFKLVAVGRTPCTSVQIDFV